MRALSLALAFALGAAAMHVLAPADATAPAWSTVASLERPRAFASAIALPTGEVLIVGGLDPADPLVTSTTSELFDPASGRVSVLPQTLLGRLHQSVSLGWGDRVVVVGGTEWVGDHWSAVDRVDVFLPYARTWIGARPLKQARSDHGAAVLRDGRVLVTGGNQGARLLRTTEIYDPSIDRWTLASSLPRARAQFSIATLLDGRVIVMGGIDADGDPTDTSYVYDPARDLWSDGPRLEVPRINHALVPLPDGDLLIVGGDGPGSGTAELYDARAQRFVFAGSLREPRVVPQATILPDGEVVVSGGLPQYLVRNGFTPMSDAEVWDPRSRLFRDVPDAPSPRAYGTFVLTGAGAFRISGSGDDESPARTIERFRLK